ncbi:MATE family efflux transporter [Pseudoflavonifractor sp. 60]|uniref:cytidylate kinase family protein n=1 Tax=Pseudoflavonifractor sp. 60 TaxID=2304576 RepID=UPI001371A073|nr:cytidylate kinase family protein [Pseudoflavonifractor sp. 60]NBI68919.1 MATE family efflux transporter [Pseudoflavonifractor sp. 60]
MEENTYLGRERVGKLLLKFAVPSTLALIISCLYNIVDQIFVGNGVGYLGNAATGIIFPITVVGWGASVLFGDGMATFLSLSQGQGNTSGAGKSVANSILGSFFSGVVIIAVYYALGDSLLYALGATEATIGLTRDYGGIILLMMPFALVQNTLASIIRADGSPRYSMAAMVTGAVINMIGDPVAIFLLDWGIRGAAFATILGQFVSFLLCAAYLGRSRAFRVRSADFVPSWRYLKPVLPLGCGSFLTQLCIVATTIANNILLKSYGARSEYGPDIPLSAFVVIINLFQIILNIACGITAGALPIMGYNYGAKLYGRVKETFKLVVLSTLTVCVIATALFETVPLVFVRMFGTDGGQLYTDFATGCLRIYLSLIVFTCLQKACAMFLQSIGHAKAAVPLSVLRDVLVIVLAILLPVRMGIMGILWSAPVADLIAMAITAAVVLQVWKKMGADAQPEAEHTESALKPSHPGVIITIAREHGTAGKQIGQLVARQMNIPCYYKEMTALAAQESGLAKEFISGINSDENAVMRELYLSTSAVRQAVLAQEKAINVIADMGSCVIIGRAADHVLRNRKNVVRIFIHAPKDVRVRKVMEMYGDTEAEGRKSIARSDAARGSYYKSISGLEWGNSRQYELTVDSSIGVEKTAQLICDYIGRM